MVAEVDAEAEVVEVAEEIEEVAVKTEAAADLVEEAEMGVAEDPATLTTLLLPVVICTGNLGKEPGGVATVTPAPGGTTRAPSQDTTETSLVKLKWKL